MAFVHGKGTAVTLDSKDLSVYSNNVQFNRSADSHETTTFGKVAKTYASGLKDGTATVQGIYDDTAATGPGAVFRPLLGGAAVEFEYLPAGGGVGASTHTVDVIVTAYEETAPVADMVTWSATLQFSDDVTSGTASA